MDPVAPPSKSPEMNYVSLKIKLKGWGMDSFRKIRNSRRSELLGKRKEGPEKDERSHHH